MLLATDLEDTVLDDAGGAERFKRAWESLDAHARPLLVYNTGGGLSETQWLIMEKRLAAPDFVIVALGTKVHDRLDPRAAHDYSASIAAGWDSGAVRRIVDAVSGPRQQPPEFLGAHKLSWHWHRASLAEIARLELRLHDAGLDVAVCYSGGVFLDVIPRRAGKGNALAWLCRRIGVELPGVVVAGASANNASMFSLPGVRGILVGNASRELLDATHRLRPFMSVASKADGVLEGLRHFGLFSAGADSAGAVRAANA